MHAAEQTSLGQLHDQHLSNCKTARESCNKLTGHQEIPIFNFGILLGNRKGIPRGRQVHCIIRVRLWPEALILDLTQVSQDCSCCRNTCKECLQACSILPKRGTEDSIQRQCPCRVIYAKLLDPSVIDTKRVFSGEMPDVTR